MKIRSLVLSSMMMEVAQAQALPIESSSPGIFDACSFSTIHTFNSTALYGSPGAAGCYDYDSNTTSRKYWAPPSQVYACISSFALDPDHVTQYLQATMDITKDYYAFTDIAVDPVKSDPNTTAFGYPIYQGTGGGQVDLMAEMKALQEKVAFSGATLDIFLEVNDIYSQLLDGHMSINLGLDTKGMLNDYSVALVAEEVLNGSMAALDLQVPFPSEDDEFVLMAGAHGGYKRIVQIDGMDPLQFFTNISSTSPFYSFLKSLGPRVQELVAALTSGKQEAFMGALVVGPGVTGKRAHINGPNLAKLFKDTYDVTYEDGATTTWHAMQAIPCPVSSNLTKEDIEESLTKPGDLYNLTMEQAAAVFSASAATEAVEPETSASKRRQGQSGMPSSIDFEMFENGDSPFGYASFDDYAVLKIYEGFEYIEEDMYDAWEQLTDKAAEQGITKLIIDVIGNGGGDIHLGYQLAQLMYPNADWTDMNNPYDLIYSPAVDIFANKVSPLFQTIQEFAQSGRDLQNITAFLNQDSVALNDKLDQVVDILSTIPSVAASNALDIVEYVHDAVMQRNTSDMQPIEVKLMLNAIIEAGQELGDPNAANSFFAFDSVESVVHNRGGIEGNYTTPYYYVDPNNFAQVKLQALSFSNPFQFEQYLLVADGNGVGSTTNTFQSTVSEYSKMNKGQVPPLDTVSFGGTGLKGDAAVTQFAGGSVQDASLWPLAVPELILAVFWIIAQGSRVGDSVFELFSEYDQAIPQPCYYCSDFPAMAVWEVYSRDTQNQGIPLEYVNQRPDFYIKQWPSKTSFEDDSHLPDLYNLVAGFFDQQFLNVTEDVGEPATETVEEEADFGEEVITERAIDSEETSFTPSSSQSVASMAISGVLSVVAILAVAV